MGAVQPIILHAPSPPQDRDDRQMPAGAPVASARSAPHKPPKPPPQPAPPGDLLAPLAVPEPAQPARLGVAIKQPPPVRLIGTLEALSIPREER